MSDIYGSDSLKDEKINNNTDNISSDTNISVDLNDQKSNLVDISEVIIGDMVQKNARNEIFEWLDVFVTAIIAVVIIFSVFFRVATIDGPSMENTLVGKDKVIVFNLFYTPKVGDIVVISRNTYNNPADYSESNVPIIKRVIATAGQTVDIDFEKGTVTVDGELLKEDYVKTPTNTKYDIDFPVLVPEGSIFVMGDNRNKSLDSRDSRIGNNGMVDTRYVLGHASFRILPFSKFGELE